MRHRITWLSLLVVALSLILAACGDDDDMGGMHMDSGSSNGSATMEMDMSTGESTADSSPMSGMDHSDHSATGSPEADIDEDLLFIDGMIAHHGSAVMMAEVALDVSEREEIRTLASEIIETQNTEIEQMREWRDAWYPNAPESDMSGMMDMAGMNMSDADMRMLRDAEDFDLMFIDMMIPHHESAIEMAEALQETTDRPELQQLTDEIITAQQAEIEQMREWREEWSNE